MPDVLDVKATLTCIRCKHQRTSFPSLVTSTTKDGQHNYRVIRCPRCNANGYVYRAYYKEQ